MADGSVTIEVELKDGQVVKGVEDIDKKLQGIDPSAQKATNSVGKMTAALGLVKVASVGFDLLNQSLDAAISRFDTMQRYPKVMSALGFSTDESTASVTKLSDGIDGLPTKLDEVVATSQRMTAITGNLNKSTDATLALNNAMLASGSSTTDASRGMQQYIQMLSTGTVDLQSWKTLQETMPVALNKTAEALGLTGDALQNQLYDALKDGSITFNEFQDELIKLGTGTGELAELAKTNSEGIATSFGNLKNAAAKGITTILESLDDLSEATTGKNIAQNIDSLKGVVNASFSAMGKVIQATTPIVKLSAEAFKLVYNTGKTLSPVLVGVAAGYAALKVIQGVNSLMTKNKELISAAKASGEALNFVLKAQTSAQVANTAATELGTGAAKAHTLAEMAKNGQLTIGTALVGVLTGQITVYELATTIATAATTAFGTALKVATGPIGLVVGGITLLVAGTTALFKWLNRDTEASLKLKKEQEELESSTKTLNDTVTQNAATRKEGLSSIKSNAKAYDELATSTANLSEKESLNKAEKKILADQVDQLNAAYSGLNLQYDEETGKLSMSSEQLKKKIALYEKQNELADGQEKMLQISKEQAEVDSKLKEMTEQREKYNEATYKTYAEHDNALAALKALDEQEKVLTETQKTLQEEYETTGESVKKASEEVATAIEEGADRQIITYESLSETQQEAVGKMQEVFQSLQEASTNAFEKMSTDAEVNLGQMVENMQHNQEVVKQWGENQAALLEWAGENGYNSFIPFIESIGTDQAGVLAEMAKGLDGTNVEQAELLKQLAETYQNGFGTAAEAGKNSMKTGLEGLPEEIRNMVITPTESLNEEVKTAFSDMGKNVGEGAKTGIDESKAQVETAAQEMAKAAGEAFANEAQIHSPSKLFQGFGEFLGQGLSNGIDSQKGLIESSINSIIESIKSPFNGLDGEMYNIGSYAIQGLNNGLSANAGSVYATAQTIANNVKSTIQSAMDVHSPSRWMKNFIGKNMMVGWQQGLETFSSLPINAIKKVSDRVKLPVYSAESALGLPGGYSVNVNQVTQAAQSSSGGNNKAILSAMSEQNNILRKILAKDPSLNLDGEKLAQSVNRSNAVEDSIRYW